MQLTIKIIKVAISPGGVASLSEFFVALKLGTKAKTSSEPFNYSKL
jgi:hypothetical protein